MNTLKKIITLTTACSFIFTSNLQSGEYNAQCTGCGYQESRRVPTYFPEVVLGVLAIAAIVVLAVENSNSSHDSHYGSGSGISK